MSDVAGDDGRESTRSFEPGLVGRGETEDGEEAILASSGAGGNCKGGRKGTVLVEFRGEGLNYAEDPWGRDIGSEMQES